MLDTKARKLVEPLINKSARSLLNFGLSANQVTWLAFIIGLTTGFFIYLDHFLLAIILLWLSGFLDTVDGSMAREINEPTSWGTLIDITFDRVVELSFIIGLALRFPEIQFSLLLMCASIILSMTVFLTVGLLSEKEGIKSFYYQAGLMERSEGFILFTLMLLFWEGIFVITLFYAGAVLFTALQRMLEARKLLK
ncbi:CDP-alcohol phosphatidyltransferase family protein [Fuchsiella alkaliacetigena]|uniref:CDP-alcohol phosphatidyltransferase family protein n=1 Tax=Fuchsiella alkaliacetigena TaxID=957042 RepID=UPI00200AFD4B|nr:CDP-alcohol phosphatidyltransferase family protein [Fuchsiella alkaliacetigena]MCK8823842.1 CDP-alcohol phosphatidyltransferase family protein [Fuchsiella alkaliacetigena]